MRYRLILMVGCWLLARHAPAPADEAAQLAAIERLGELNGIALHCGALQETRRMKQALVANLPKRRRLGELFDHVTNRAFMALIQRQSECPTASELERQVDEAVAGLAQAFAAHPPQPLPPVAADASPADARIGGGRFVLTDQYGRLVTPESMQGRYQLLYFGYTHCPDICPNTLQIVSLALDRLGPQAERIQPYLVTVDPARDTIEVLREYIDYFDPRFLGVTGNPAMIERMTAHYRVKYEKVEGVGDDPAYYLMDHSASLYLMAPDGRFLKKFIYGITPAQLAEQLAEILP